MMTKIIVPVLLILLFSGCSASKHKNENPEVSVQDSHNAENSLDWQGTYFGILPCASCEGVETEITLLNNQTYVLISRYLGEIANADTLKGNFQLSGNTLVLNDISPDERPNRFLVEENQLRQLDINGKRIVGEFAAVQILKKIGNPLVENKRWQLVELNGRTIKGNPKTHFIYFHSENHFLEVKANCNSLSFEYRITNDNKLSLKQGTSTLLDCLVNIDDEVTDMIMKSNHFELSGNQLSFHKKNNYVLARFQWVEEN